MHPIFERCIGLLCARYGAFIPSAGDPAAAAQHPCVTQDARAAVALIEADRFLPEKDGICVKSVLRLYRLFSVEKGARDSF
jgi:hypothetical protein